MVKNPVGKEPGTRRFDPWVGKFPWRRKWQHTKVFWPGEFHGLMSLAGPTVHGVAKCGVAKCWTLLSN